MANGDYPFLAYVWNRFAKPPAGEKETNLSVTFNHYFNGICPDPTGENRPPPDNHHAYVIKPGDMVAFPLFWACEKIITESGVTRETIGENLVIKIEDNSQPPVDPYYISLGSLAVYHFIDNEGNPVDPPDGEHIPSGSPANLSGIYKVAPGTQWIVNMEKLLFDPETTNVSVGPDIP